MLKWLLGLVLLLASSDAYAASVFWSQNVTLGGGASCGDGTFKWDADSGTAGAGHKCWATLTGGTVAAAIPAAGDTATFDASSGGGTVVVAQPNNASGAAQVSVGQIICGAFTGTLDFATNNNNVTMNGGSGFNCSGAGTRTLNLGSGTFTLTSTNAPWTMTTTTGLTFSGASATIQFTAANCASQFASGGLTYGTLLVGCTNGFVQAATGTFTTITINAGNTLQVVAAGTLTVTTITDTGTASSGVAITSSGTSVGTITSSSAQALSWVAISNIAFAGVGTWTISNSLAGGHTTVAVGAISAPAAAGSTGGGGYIIGN